MIHSTIHIPKQVYHDIYSHLIPKEIKAERVAFVFAAVSQGNKVCQFHLKDWYAVKPNEYEYQSLNYVELIDEMRPKIIKKAFDMDAAIVEVHSHPYATRARFSYSDLLGFEDFVPHVWWRLKGKPYAAIVFSKIDFDALVWIDSPQKPFPLTKMRVGEKCLYPNRLTFEATEEIYDFNPF